MKKLCTSIKTYLCLILCFSLINPEKSFAQQGNDSPVVAAYYENWSQYRSGPGLGGRPVFFPNLIDPAILTDLYFAFGIFGFVSRSIDPNNPHLTGDYTVQPLEWNDQSVLYPQCVALKQINPNLKLHLSIGGWSFNDPNDPNGMGQYTYRLFSQMVASSANRQQFIQSAIAYAHQFGFDGVDIDWEYPGDPSRGGNPEDFNNFVTFLSECSAAFHAANPPLTLTYASAAIVPSAIPQTPQTYFTWLAQCAQYLDMINIMAYDYHGPFDNPKLTGVNAPLNHDTNPSSTYYIAQTIQNYLTYGVPASKMVLGMPTYGHSYGGVPGLTPTDNGPGKPFTTAGKAGPATLSPGFLAYFEISDMVTLNQLTFGTDSLTSTALGYNMGEQEWVSFDTPDTIALKAQEAKNNTLKGIMFWAVDNDEYAWGTKYPNIRSGFNVLYPQLATAIVLGTNDQVLERMEGLINLKIAEHFRQIRPKASVQEQQAVNLENEQAHNQEENSGTDRLAKNEDAQPSDHSHHHHHHHHH